MDLSTPEHLQSKVMCKKKMSSLAKITHAVITEGRNWLNLYSFFLENTEQLPNVLQKIPFGNPIWKKH